MQRGTADLVRVTGRLSIGGCRAGQTAILVLLLVVVPTGCREIRSGDVAARLPPGTPALHRAAALDQVSEVRRLAGKGINTPGPNGWTPLHYAAIFRGRAAARTLIEQRAHLDPVDGAGMTPLHWAARKGEAQIVKRLLDAGAEVMARNAFDMTPLHEASTSEAVLALLARGADLHARDLDGMTPLHTAPTREVAQLLIAKGADVNAKSKDGRTPMDMPPGVLPRVE
jgi:ankyrin repeat protein